MAAATRHLVASKSEKVAELAMASKYLAIIICNMPIDAHFLLDVAVDDLLESAVKMWRRVDSAGKTPFARIYSESQIQSQWTANEYDLLNSPYHLDRIRFQRAQFVPSKWQDYLGGRNELRTNGVFSSEDAYDAYTKNAVALSHEVLDSYEVQSDFCAVVSCDTPNLYMKVPKIKTIK